MTEAPENVPTVATSAPEPRADQIQYLTPTPPGFAPEYDYLALLQSLRNSADFATAGSSDSSTPQLLKEIRITEYNCRKRFVDSSGSSDHTSSLRPDSKSEAEWMYEQIDYVRKMLIGGTEGGARVLVVDNINCGFLQILGVAIDLDPTFLWRHLNGDLDLDRYSSGMATLRNKYFELIAAEKWHRVGTDAGQESSTDKDRSIHIRYKSEEDDWFASEHEISSHISCYPCSANSCR